MIWLLFTHFIKSKMRIYVNYTMYSTENCQKYTNKYGICLTTYGEQLLQNKTLTWDTPGKELPDFTDCMKQAVRPLPALLLALAYLIGCKALIRAQRPPHLDDVGFSWLLFARVRLTLLQRVPIVLYIFAHNEYSALHS